MSKLPGWMLAGAALASLAGVVWGCSWDRPIWEKDKRSDTALFRFVADGKAGFIDRSGRVVIPPKFKVYGNHGYDDFFEGVASAGLLRREFMDATGKQLSFAPREVIAWSRFSEGLIAATRGGEARVRFGFVNREGTMAIEPAFESVGDFSEGLAAVRVEGRWGYIDHSGTLAIPPRFLMAEEFAEGAARVVEDGPCSFRGYGPCAIANISVLGGEGARPGRKAQVGRCLYSFLNRMGGRLFPQRFPDAFDFSEGLAAVGTGQRWGFIDKSGAMRIPLSFAGVGSFSEGLARFREGRRWGFLDREGRAVIAAQYESAEDFSEGAAVVGSSYSRVWFIDRNGRRLFDRDFTRASSFRLGLAHVSDGKKFHYIDRSGREVFTYEPGPEWEVM